MRLDEFNSADWADAVEMLRPCVDVRRWCEEVADGRPYASVDELVGAAGDAAAPFTADEIEAALAHHPRIGERPSGEGTEAAMSRREQSGVDPADAATAAAFDDGNRAYEARFGRVFLIRAAGRSAAEMLEALEARLGNTPEVEDAVVAEQLREIALLRLRGIFTA